MTASSRPSFRESQPLLDESFQSSRPPSYSTIVSNDSDSTLRGSDHDDDDPPPLNQLSQRDLCLVLAGLWSAVFLGALDGDSTIITSISIPHHEMHAGTIVATLLTRTSRITSHWGSSS